MDSDEQQTAGSREQHQGEADAHQGNAEPVTNRQHPQAGKKPQADQQQATGLQQQGRAMGLGDVRGMVIPKPVVVSPPTSDGTLQVRYFMPHNCHRSVAATGAIGLATACAVAGSIAQDIAPISGEALVRLEHPGGQIEVSLQPAADGQPQNMRASLVRTARRLFSGEVYVPVSRRTGT